MKILFNFFLVALCTLSCLKLIAQEAQISTRSSVFTTEELEADKFGIFNSGRNAQVLYDFNSTESTSTGSPFVMSFKMAQIDGYKHNYMMRYDAYNDEMQAKNSKDKIMVLNKEKIKEVIFNDGVKYKVFDYEYDKKETNGYLKVLHTGENIILLKKQRIIFLPAKKAKSSYQPATPETFKRMDDIYFVSNLADGSIKPFYKKKEFVSLFTSHKKALEEFIKSNKLKFSKEKDVMSLVSHLETLIN